jgi:hypothetical protein
MQVPPNVCWLKRGIHARQQRRHVMLLDSCISASQSMQSSTSFPCFVRRARSGQRHARAQRHCLKGQERHRSVHSRSGGELDSHVSLNTMLLRLRKLPASTRWLCRTSTSICWATPTSPRQRRCCMTSTISCATTRLQRSGSGSRQQSMQAQLFGG